VGFVTACLRVAQKVLLEQFPMTSEQPAGTEVQPAEAVGESLIVLSVEEQEASRILQCTNHFDVLQVNPTTCTPAVVKAAFAAINKKLYTSKGLRLPTVGRARAAAQAAMGALSDNALLRKHKDTYMDTVRKNREQVGALDEMWRRTEEMEAAAVAALAYLEKEVFTSDEEEEGLPAADAHASSEPTAKRSRAADQSEEVTAKNPKAE
jgi:hypothetical protein